jgi:hypothetical protein
MPSTLNADSGAVSGSAGLKSSADSSGVLQLQTNGTTAVTVDASQNVGVGVTPASWYSTARAIQMGTTGSVFGRTGNELVGVASNAYNDAVSSTSYKYIASGNFATNYLQTTGQHQWFVAPSGTAGNAITFTQAMTLDNGGRLGVGATSISAQLHVRNANGNNGLGSDNTGMALVESTFVGASANANASFVAKNYYGYGQFMQWQELGMRIGSRATANGGTGTLVFTYGNDAAGMTLSGSQGNLGIGVTPKTWDSGSKALQIGASGALWCRTSDNLYILSSNAYFDGSTDRYIAAGYASRMYQNGSAFTFQTGGLGSADAPISFATVLTINSSASATYSMQMQNDSGHASMGTTNSCWMYLSSGQIRIIPRYANGTVSDNVIDLGDGGSRMRVIYAGTGSINTSDANEKQDIQEFTDAEKRVAVKIKALFKTYRFKDAVVEKGDDARIHVGVIAQEVRDAFTSEGLDAHRYALFCSDTWYTLNNKDLKENGERFTADDEGAVEKTRLGIRYSELLSFVISAL